MSTLVIEQPNYIPWLGYFDLLDRADVWVWYDDVQYTKRDWRNRNRVAADGDPVWLTIPVRVQDHREKRICEIEIDHRQDWVRKHLDTLRHLYGKAPFFEAIFPRIQERLEARPDLLADLTIPLNEDLCDLLGLEAEFHRSSEMAGIEGAKQERILSVCRQIRPTVYLSGPAAEAYLEPEPFEQEGIRLEYIHYRYADYPRGGQGPQTSLSILDPLCWIGPEATREILRGSRSGGRP